MSDDRSTRLTVPSGRRAVLGVLVAVLLVAGVGLLFARVAGFSEVRDAIERADSSWFVVCLLAQVLALSAYATSFAARWRGEDRPDPGAGAERARDAREHRRDAGVRGRRRGRDRGLVLVLPARTFSRRTRRSRACSG